MKFRFNKYYFLLAIATLIIEILIGLYVRDAIIRPFGGDVLVVVLIYCFVSAFIDTDKYLLATLVLVFSFSIEVLQYYRFVKTLGLQNNKLISIILGTSFSWYDMLSYFIGYVIILIGEKITTKNQQLS